MRFRILGPLEVATDRDEGVTPQALKLRSLLAALCVHADRVVPTQRLINALWAGAPPRTASTALQVYISKLRRHFGNLGADSSIIVTQSPGYVLRLKHHSLDLRHFDSTVLQAREALGAGLPREAAQLLSEATQLWNGPALADVRATPILNGYARQLEERRNATYERRLELELGLGRHSELIGELYGLVHDHPMWENLHAYLMIALYRSGRIRECLRTYSNIRQALVEEIGVEPCALLRNLHRAVLSREARLDDPGQGLLTSSRS